MIILDGLLAALQEGRLLELPDDKKDDALHFLSHVIEAIPSRPPGTDVLESVMARERSTNSALGKGWACPHARVSFDADLLCVLGWSPTGIDYGAPDGMPVSIIAMYLAPENQRRRFLREASVLVKALAAYPERGKLNSAKELSEIRGILLDLISSTEVTVGPGTMARMIRLQAGQIVPSKPADDLANLVVEPVTIIASPGAKPVVLARNLDLMDYLDSVSGVIEKLSSDGVFKNGGWRILKRGEVIYRGG